MKIASIGLFATVFLVGTALWQSPPAQTQGASRFAIASSGNGGTAFRLNVETGQVHFCQVSKSSYGRKVEGSCTALVTE